MKCPFCAEEIKDEAIKCKHCHSDLIRENETKVIETQSDKVAPSTLSENHEVIGVAQDLDFTYKITAPILLLLMFTVTLIVSGNIMEPSTDFVPMLLSSVLGGWGIRAAWKYNQFGLKILLIWLFVSYLSWLLLFWLVGY